MSGTAGGRSSLVDGKNNSRDPSERDTVQSTLSEEGFRPQFDENQTDSDRYDCRQIHRTLELEAEDGETAGFRCDSWDCYCCAHRMRMNLIEEMERLVEARPELRRFLTLTVDSEVGPARKEGQHRHLTDRFNALRTELNDRYPGLSYVWIRHEGDENGRPHLHLLVDRYLPQNELSDLSRRVGLGEVVDIRRVEARNAAHYLTSYLGRGALASLPKGLQRYGSSSDIELSVRGGEGDSRDWALMMDDWEIVDDDGEPLRRKATRVDIAQQRDWQGPVPPDADLGG